MAYKYSKGPQVIGDLSGSDDVDRNTGIDWEEDYIGFEAGGSIIMVVSGSKVGVGTTTPDYTLDVGGTMGVDEYIYHNGDDDTFIRFQDDDITIKAGDVNCISFTSASQCQLICNDGRDDIDFIVRSPNESLAVYLNANNEVFHINHGESAFKTKIHSTNGEAITVNNDGVIFNEDSHEANDFRVESDGEDEAIFLDASSNTLYVNKGATGFTTVIKNNNEEVIRVGAAGVIFNEYGHDSNDFRIESDNDTHAFFVDSGNDVVGIATSSPIAKLDVAFAMASTIFVFCRSFKETSLNVLLQ